VQAAIKRAFDVTVASTLLVALSPLLAVLAVLVRALDGPPVLFRQRRSGQHGRSFDLCKFRTMTTGSDDPTTDAQRITRLGRVLRRTSLDELPTLWNVVAGHMSLVGPRPLPERYLGRYDQRQRRRLQVRPGVTGLAQATGRNLLSWEERFELDVQYVERATLRTDLRILLDTAKSVLRREGVEVADTVTMPEFWGSERG
jgi:lipopolysaccharide/colanic/teichoic acid biosynthesis glycosyltransferase